MSGKYEVYTMAIEKQFYGTEFFFNLLRLTFLLT